MTTVPSKVVSQCLFLVNTIFFSILVIKKFLLSPTDLFLKDVPFYSILLGIFSFFYIKIKLIGKPQSLGANVPIATTNIIGLALIPSCLFVYAFIQGDQGVSYLAYVVISSQIGFHLGYFT